MWLLHTKTFSLKKFNRDVPEYVILSHRWGKEDDEVTFADIQAGTDQIRRKRGYRKILETCHIARKNGYEWIWTDTCCIDQTNSVELNEAINSMYNWYKNSAFCVAYLEDYQPRHDSLGDSTWFTRCWTLQELISPSDVRFYDTEWRCFGSKRSLCREVSEITGIDTQTLSGSDPRRCSVAQRMSWAAGRHATRIEDEAYSLLGLFDISLPMLYGHKDKAFMALQAAILQSPRDHDDQSIFAWGRDVEQAYQGLLARGPVAFADCCHNKRLAPLDDRCGFSYSGFEISLDLPTLPYGINTYLCVLDCTSDSTGSDTRDCIILERSEDQEQYARLRRTKAGRLSVKSAIIKEEYGAARRKMLVRQIPRNPSTNMIHGFLIESLNLPNCKYREYGEMHVQTLEKTWRKKGPDPILSTLPMYDWGTVTNIFVSRRTPRCNHHQHLSYIKLGFDKDFHPRCTLGLESPWRLNNGPRSWDENMNFKNDWLCRQSEDHDSAGIDKWELAVDEINLGRASHRMKKARLRLDFDIVDYSPDFDIRELPKCGSGPWKIWRVKIRKLDDFYEDDRSRQDENRRLRRQDRKVEEKERWKLRAVNGTVAAVLLSGFLA